MRLPGSSPTNYTYLFPPADGSLSLSFINLDAEVKFAVSLRLPGSYPAGAVQQQARIWFGGELAAWRHEATRADGSWPCMRGACGWLGVAI